MQQTETLDTALWTALRALEENASLNQQMAVRAGRRGNGALAARFRANAQLAERRAGVLRDALASGRQLEPAPQSDQRDEEAAAARSH
jgi:two-component system chemotaxis response regulator CheB